METGYELISIFLHIWKVHLITFILIPFRLDTFGSQDMTSLRKNAHMLENRGLLLKLVDDPFQTNCLGNYFFGPFGAHRTILYRLGLRLGMHGFGVLVLDYK